jgi:hypothetical protein
VNSIYAYGVYHGFNDIIADLLVQERNMLLQKTGFIFDSPLVKWQSTGQEHPKVLDYYPMAKARGKNMTLIKLPLLRLANSPVFFILFYFCSASSWLNQ